MEPEDFDELTEYFGNGEGDDVSEYDEEAELFVDDEPPENMTDVEADADVLRSCGWGNDEDYLSTEPDWT